MDKIVKFFAEFFELILRTWRKTSDVFLHFILFFVLQVFLSFFECLLIAITIELTQFEVYFHLGKENESNTEWFSKTLNWWFPDMLKDLIINLLGYLFSYCLYNFIF